MKFLSFKEGVSPAHRWLWFVVVLCCSSLGPQARGQVASGRVPVSQGLSAQAPSSVAREMLQPTFPEEFSINASQSSIWRALSEEVAGTSNSRVLVSDSEDFLISWVELSDGAKNPLSSLAPKPMANGENHLMQTELKEVGGDRVAVTTVLIIPAQKGSIIRFRRIYYGTHTQPRITNSTGKYETWLMSKISTRLGL